MTLHTNAVLIDGYVSRFQESEQVSDGEVLLPVVGDQPPALGPNERLCGPDYEVLPDRVRAFWRAAPMTAEEITARDAARPRMSFAQLLIGLVAEGWMSEADGELWLAGVLPASITSLIAGMPQEMRFPAKARAIRPSEVLQDDPLLQAIAAAQGKGGELPRFFDTYSKV